MRYKHAFYIFLAVALLGMFGLQSEFTGFAVQEKYNFTLLDKLEPPCFCPDGLNITEQENAYYSLVESAEQSMERGQISEEFAINIMNNYAAKTCKKCALQG
ncbi:hypothetical protein KY346_06110 [Candidatus Woesearchaeota archaeon]|nr:hypothetical protein [Candidatus Woesearchaeota archaeon]